FSSRRRHTRCLSDWSSDVCSSDLQIVCGFAYVQAFLLPGFPASPLSFPVDREIAEGLKAAVGRTVAAWSLADKVLLEEILGLPRSEERRVGKECRSRQGRKHNKNK